MEDKTYVEQMVSRNTDTKSALIRVGTIAASIVISYMVFAFLGAYKMPAIYGVVFLIAPAFLIYYVFSITSVEFEYLLVKNELTIDGIYGKNKRKTLQTIDVSKCEMIAQADNTYVVGYHRNTTMKSVDYSSGNAGNDLYLMIVPYGAAMMKVYFEPGQRMLEGLRMAAPGKFKK